MFTRPHERALGSASCSKCVLERSHRKSHHRKSHHDYIQSSICINISIPHTDYMYK